MNYVKLKKRRQGGISQGEQRRQGLPRESRWEAPERMQGAKAWEAGEGSPASLSTPPWAWEAREGFTEHCSEWDVHCGQTPALWALTQRRVRAGARQCLCR